jgi:hypothetical protein
MLTQEQLLDVWPACLSEIQASFRLNVDAGFIIWRNTKIQFLQFLKIGLRKELAPFPSDAVALFMELRIPRDRDWRRGHLACKIS